MKKSIAILLALLMMAGTLGCSSENAEEKETAQSDTTSSVGETEAQEMLCTTAIFLWKAHLTQKL